MVVGKRFENCPLPNAVTGVIMRISAVTGGTLGYFGELAGSSYMRRVAIVAPLSE